MPHKTVKLSCWLPVQMRLSSKVKLPPFIARNKNVYLDLKIVQFLWYLASIFHLPYPVALKD